MRLKRTPGFLKNPGVDSGLALGGVGGWGGDDDDSVAQTHQTVSPQEPFTRYLQYFRDVGPSLIVTNCTLDFANSTLGFARACPPFFSSIVAFGGGWGGA